MEQGTLPLVVAWSCGRVELLRMMNRRKKAKKQVPFIHFSGHWAISFGHGKEI